MSYGGGGYRGRRSGMTMRMPCFRGTEYVWCQVTTIHDVRSGVHQRLKARNYETWLLGLVKAL